MPANSEEYARSATPPDTSNLSEVRGASRECTACHLYKRATQTVFGEGPKNAPIMLVGEQPGDYEDVAGKPFVGPSFRVTRERGKLLSSKLASKVVATVHPSSLLRQPDEESRKREYKRFVVDLRTAVKASSEI